MNIIKKYSINSKVSNFLLLNLLGFQVIKYLLAKTVTFIQIKFSNYKINNNYSKNGYLLINDFLDTNEFNNLADEFAKLMDEDFIIDSFINQKNINSKIRVYYYNFTPNKYLKANYPILSNLYNNKLIRSHFENNERSKNIDLTMQIERVVGVNGTNLDAQQVWHVDTFHDTHKAWLYINNVKSNNAPFNFIVKSQLLSLKRLLWEWYQSIVYCLRGGDPSFRVNKRDIIYNKEEKNIITCNKNSILFANSHGIHKRGKIKPNYVREAIHFDVRSNPF